MNNEDPDTAGISRKSVYSSEIPRKPHWKVSAAAMSPATFWMRRLAYSLLVRVAKHMEVPVVVVGGPGTGKSFLMEKTFPGGVVLPKTMAEHFGQTRPVRQIEFSKTGKCPAVIDEVAYLDAQEAALCLEHFSSNAPVLVVQDVAVVARVGLDRLFTDKRALILELVKQRKPADRA